MAMRNKMTERNSIDCEKKKQKYFAFEHEYSLFTIRNTINS